MSSEMKRYIKGEDARLEATFTDEDGTKVDPDSAYIAVRDASNKVVVADTTSMTKDEVGVYFYNFDTGLVSVLGVCEWDAILTKTDFCVRERGTFEVVEAVG